MKQETKSVTVLALGFGLVGIDRYLITPLFPIIAHDLLLRVNRKSVSTARAVDSSKIVHLSVPEERIGLVVTFQVGPSDNKARIVDH